MSSHATKFLFLSTGGPSHPVSGLIGMSAPHNRSARSPPAFPVFPVIQSLDFLPGWATFSLFPPPKLVNVIEPSRPYFFVLSPKFLLSVDRAPCGPRAIEILGLLAPLPYHPRSYLSRRPSTHKKPSPPSFPDWLPRLLSSQYSVLLLPACILGFFKV